MSNLSKRKYYNLLPNISREELMMPFDSLIDQMLKDHFPRTDFGTNFTGKGSYPKVNLISAKDCVVLEASIPGMEKDDIKISVKDNVLEISGSSNNKPSEGGRKFLIREIKKTKFKRSFVVEDANIDLENINASIDKGILTIKIPRINKVEDKTRYISID